MYECRTFCSCFCFCWMQFLLLILDYVFVWYFLCSAFLSKRISPSNLCSCLTFLFRFYALKPNCYFTVPLNFVIHLSLQFPSFTTWQQSCLTPLLDLTPGSHTFNKAERRKVLKLSFHRRKLRLNITYMSSPNAISRESMSHSVTGKPQNSLSYVLRAQHEQMNALPEGGIPFPNNLDLIAWVQQFLTRPPLDNRETLTHLSSLFTFLLIKSRLNLSQKAEFLATPNSCNSHSCSLFMYFI